MGKPNFSLSVDEVELGLGIHGEPGLSKQKLKSVDEHVVSEVTWGLICYLARVIGCDIEGS